MQSDGRELSKIDVHTMFQAKHKSETLAGRVANKFRARIELKDGFGAKSSILVKIDDFTKIDDLGGSPTFWRQIMGFPYQNMVFVWNVARIVCFLLKKVSRTFARVVQCIWWRKESVLGPDCRFLQKTYILVARIR